MGLELALGREAQGANSCRAHEFFLVQHPQELNRSRGVGRQLLKMIERYRSAKFFPPWIRNEHFARYEFVCHFVRNKIVVDAACGDGAGSDIFSRAGAKIVQAFDISKKTVEEAKHKYSLDRLSFQTADCLHLPIADHVADVFVSLETIEHLTDDVAFLDEVTRILDPSGLFICSSPNRDVTNPKTSLEDKPMNPYHVREYASNEYQELLKKYFSSVESYGQNLQNDRFLKCLYFLRHFLPVNVVIGIQRIIKLRWLIHDSTACHRVMRTNEPQRYEYLVSVCSGPKRRMNT